MNCIGYPLHTAGSWRPQRKALCASFQPVNNSGPEQNITIGEGKNKLVLCDEKTSRVSVYVCAELAGGCLKISGQDLGQAVEDTFEVDEYEYFYDFDRDNTARLFSLLGTADQKVEERFLEMFGGMDGCRASPSKRTSYSALDS